MKSEFDILIIGAGLSGLSAAWHLRNSGKKIKIIEKEYGVGGYTKTTFKDGFRFDHTGHLLHLRDESIKKWVVNDLFKKKIPKLDRISRVWSHNVYTRYPFQANTYGLPEKVSKECIDEYLKVLKNPPKKKVVTAEDFIYKHFGKGFAKHFMIPYNKKIWGVHPRELSAKWGERFIPIPKKDEVLAGTKPGPDLKLGYNSSFYYPKFGMGELSERIYNSLQKIYKVDFGISVVSIDMKKREVLLSTGEIIKYKKIINSMPLVELVRCIKDAPAYLKKKSKLLKCQSLYYLDIALNKKPLHSFHWCYVPSPQIPFYRVGIYSNFSPVLAPKGKGSLYVELSSRKFDKKNLSRVTDYLKKMGFIKNQKDIKFIKPNLIKYAYVIYDKNYFKVVPAIHKMINKNNIYSIGRWGAWNYSSMEDALIMGREIAKKL